MFFRVIKVDEIRINLPDIFGKLKRSKVLGLFESFVLKIILVALHYVIDKLNFKRDVGKDNHERG